MKTIFNDIVLIVFKWWHFHWVSIHSIVIFWCFQNIKENFRHLRSIKLEILSLFDIELEIHFQLQNYNFRNWIVSSEWAFDHVFNFGVYSFFWKKDDFFYYLIWNLVEVTRNCIQTQFYLCDIGSSNSSSQNLNIKIP